MNWPFVSRGRFEDAMERIKALEEEKAVLTDRLLVAYGAKPMRAPEIMAVQPVEPGEQKKPVAPRTRPSPFEISSMATEAKRREKEAAKAVS